jgi:hypothetical protein
MLLRRKTVAEVEKVDSLKEQAYEMLSALISAATQAGDFIKDQIPLVIQELLAFNTVKYAVLVVVGAAVTAVGVFWIRYCLKKYEEADDEWSDWNFATIPGFVAAPIGVTILVVYVVSLLKITIAPRVWLIEYAAELVR